MISPLQKDKNSNSHGALKKQNSFQISVQENTHLLQVWLHPGFRTDSHFMSSPSAHNPEPKV